MANDTCPREGDVIRAESGELAPDLQAHLATCEGCRDVRAVTLCLREGIDDAGDTPLPDAAAIWWRAEVQAQEAARARALRPLDAMERAEPAIAIAAVATLIVMRGDAIAARAFGWIGSDATSQMLAVLPPALVPVLATGLALCGLVLLIGLGAVVAHD